MSTFSVAAQDGDSVDDTALAWVDNARNTVKMRAWQP